MTLIDKNVKAIEADPELQAKLRELWVRDAPVSDFYDLLSSAGLDVTMENLEGTHAELQRRRGEEIADMEKVDPEQLRKIAGGGQGLDCSTDNDCDYNFKSDRYWSKERCRFQNYCDEYYDALSCGNTFDKCASTHEGAGY